MEKFSILVSDPNDRFINFAIKELEYFTEKICSFKPEVITKDNGKRFVAIGIKNNENSIFERIDELQEDGYIIATLNNNYYIYGGSVYGMCYGVYALLNKLCGLEFYSYKDFDYGEFSYKEINIIDNPDIPIRCLGIDPYHDETINGGPMLENMRMRFRRMVDGWGLITHSYFKILPPQIYKEKHPSWYSPQDDGANLCLTNKEMRLEFIERLKKIILDNPNSTTFMLGQEDGYQFCQCDNCKKAYEEAGNNFSYVMAEFTNEVVKAINKWAKEVIPQRKLMFVMFAYVYTINPPVKEVDGELVSNLDFELEDNLAVMLAPLHSNSTYSYFDERNYESMDKKYNTDKKVSVNYLANGWNKVSKHLFFWAYGIDNLDWNVPFDMWNVIEENFKNYVKYNVYYLFDEGTYHTIIPNWNGLRAYIFSKIAWNTKLKVKDIMEKYFNHTFGPYSNKMMEIFKFTHNYIRKRAKKDNRPMLYVKFDDFENLGTTDYLELDVLLNLKKEYDELLNVAKEPYKYNIYEESFSINYLLFNLYREKLDVKTYESARKTTLDLATKYNMFKDREGTRPVFVLKDELLKQRN